MYCKNCGAPISPNASVCTKCGFARGNGNNYCQNCGSQVNPGASVCLNCGAQIQGFNNDGTQKSKLVAVLLAFFLGSLGIHNFYLGYTSTAIWQIVITVVTCGTCSWIWPLIDFIRLLINNIDTDANGVPLKKEF